MCACTFVGEGFRYLGGELAQDQWRSAPFTNEHKDFMRRGVKRTGKSQLLNVRRDSSASVFTFIEQQQLLTGLCGQLCSLVIDILYVGALAYTRLI